MKLEGKYKDCLFCCHLSDGVEKIGEFPGEYKATADNIDSSKIKLGPMNLRDFGAIRSKLGWDYCYDDGPPWYLDIEIQMIYLGRRPHSLVNKVIKNYGVEMRERSWTNPIVHSIQSVDEKNKKVKLSVYVGVNREVLSVVLPEGVETSELASLLSELSSELRKVPKDNVFEILLEE
ncbi:hypothetical protein KKC45_01085 [Patescibacteria group bacterium]|nr:hypothetical protein [Patescibacteria group bacterium]